MLRLLRELARSRSVASLMLIGAASILLTLASPLGGASTGETVGNLAPSGPHYNLNIVGVQKGKGATMTSGNKIFVPLETAGVCPANDAGQEAVQINLSEGDFAVVDANGTAGESPACVAAFQLPNPDPTDADDPENDGSTFTTYSVYARALGTPGGSATMTACFTDEMGDTYCNTGQQVVVFDRDAGQSVFGNVSQQLLTICHDHGNPNPMTPNTPNDTDCSDDGEHVHFLFDDDSNFWSYDNEGLKLAQLRFYPNIPTTLQ